MQKLKIKIFLLLVISLALPCYTKAADKLLQQSDIEYLGAFRLPEDPEHGGTLWDTDYAGHGLAFRPPTPGHPNGSLFISGHIYYSKVAEIGIPNTFVNSSSVSDLPRSELIQPLTDILGSKKSCIYTNNTCMVDSNNQMGGLFVYNNRLIGTLYDYYSYAPDQERSHFSAPLTLSANSATGIYQPSSKSRSVAGHMCSVPSAYQAALGGPVLTGLHDIPIITATSYGPTAFSFNPDNLSMSSTFTVNPLMYVDSTSYHTVYGYWTGTGPANPVMASTDEFGGLVFPEGSKSILFFGPHGDGLQCYGEATNNPALHGLSQCGGETCCYDLELSSKGSHAYPYVYQVWAYNVDDLISVRNGTLAHNSVVPYEYWHLNFPTTSGAHIIMGVAYDSATQRIYVGQNYVDNATTPVIQVFHVNISTSPDTNSPATPTGLSIL